MHFDTDNPIVQLCGQGMMLEGEGSMEAAHKLFLQAWAEAGNAFEQSIAAHYVARHQPDIAGKLKWDLIALEAALSVETDEAKATYPSLYLNVAKCYEDLGDPPKALACYELGDSFTGYLEADGYGNMIRAGIRKGKERVQA